jgi:hypothetical protein
VELTIVDSAKFTPVELAVLAAEAVSWWKQQREEFLPYGVPLGSAQKMPLMPFFTEEILGRFRMVNLLQTGGTIPTPPFYEKILATNSSLLPDPAHSMAMPFIDVAVFSHEPTPRTLFHTLVHVTQLALVGLEGVIESYFRTVNMASLWAANPFEEQAYRLEERFAGNPANAFSVEEEIRESARRGRYSNE